MVGKNPESDETPMVGAPMEGYGAQIGLVLVLVVLNAVFAGSEIALVTLREG